MCGWRGTTSIPINQLPSWLPDATVPFSVEQVLSPVTYKLSLPSTWNVHPVFHIDLLTPYWETPFHGENYQRPPAELVQGIEEYEVEEVLGMRHMEDRGSCCAVAN